MISSLHPGITSLCKSNPNSPKEDHPNYNMRIQNQTEPLSSLTFAFHQFVVSIGSNTRLRSASLSDLNDSILALSSVSMQQLVLILSPPIHTIRPTGYYVFHL